VTYGAIGDGVTDDTAAIQAADTAAAAVGGTVFFPDGEYAATSLTISSGVTWEGSGNAEILNCHLTATGTAGAEIEFTGDADPGDTSIPIPATGLTDSWLRIVSAINCQSADAGAWQLGHVTSQHTYFAEFVRVKTGGVADAELYGPLVFPYVNTPGADTYGAFTTAVARVITFHEGGRLRKLKFRGKNAAENDTVALKFCRDFVIEDCNVDANDLTTQNVRMDYCFDCHMRGGSLTARRNSVPAGSTANPLIIAGSQLCTGNDVSIYFGNQGVDITYFPNDTTYRGGPSLFCSVTGSRSFDAATDGFCTHQGCWASTFDDCTTIGAVNGVRIRSRNDRVTNCKLINGAGTGNGVKINAGAVAESLVADNFILGYLQGIEVVHETDEAGYLDLHTLLGQSQCVIRRNHIRDSADHAVYVNTAPTSAVLVGPRIVDNEIHGSVADPIAINAYNNGTLVDNNRIYGVAAADGGIQWTVNNKRLHIGTNHIYGVDAAGFALRGAGVASMMTDAVTFPGGEAEAELFIGQTFTDAATPFTGILRDASAYVQPQVAGWQPFVAGVNDAAPTLERSSIGIYWDGTTGLKLDRVDNAGTATTVPLGARRVITVYDGTTQSGNNTWDHPLGMVELEYILIGAGGPGGSGCKGPAGSNRTGGSGGGSGARTIGHILASALSGSSTTIRVAGAGTGGASITANDTAGKAGTAHANNITQILNGTSRANASSGDPGLGGALASASVSGQSGGNGTFNGATGGNGTNAAGANGGLAGGAPGAGGGGGGLDTGNTSKAGGTGGVSRQMASSAATLGGTDPGGNGADGASFDVEWGTGFGGGGGASDEAGNGGKGGKGGKYGGGGGGGGAAQNSAGDSGAGGDSGPGLVVLIAYCE
jgi:hypothetical protein